MKHYKVDFDAKRIDVFDERFYIIKVGGKEYVFYNVTGWLKAFPKGEGYEKWLINNKDPYEMRDKAADFGSQVHNLIEKTLNGESATYYDGMDVKVWERYLMWCNFWHSLLNNPEKVLGLKGIKEIQAPKDFTEFTVYDINDEAAGTVDKMIKVIFNDDTFRFVIIDWKSGEHIYPTHKIQIATYSTFVKRMFKIEEPLAYIVQIHPSLNKKGWRVTTVEGIDHYYQIFKYTQYNYKEAFGEPKPKFKTYPTEIDTEYIKNNLIEV